jgi:hypothetical protein
MGWVSVSVCVIVCISTSTAYSICTGIVKATLDTRGGGGTFHRGRLLITARITSYHWSVIVTGILSFSGCYMCL